ncbi:hypothetical protein CDAR_5341 [Caerostris darwini]|uniref:Uncharacterized protein n=1 Tax=Caerostris darwini TaxID=1538125 RepID=A0AAV4R5D3_9ARAC|nr:hypothetical protein CDAR_5341 [Caerostris darwini]
MQSTTHLPLPPQDDVASNCNRNRRGLFRLTALPVLIIRSMCLSSENAREEWVHNRLAGNWQKIYLANLFCHCHSLNDKLRQSSQQHICRFRSQNDVASNCNRNRRRLFRLTALPVLKIRSMCLSSERMLKRNGSIIAWAGNYGRSISQTSPATHLPLPPQDDVASNCNRNRRRLFRLTALPVLQIRSMCLSSENASEEWVHNRLGRKLAEDLSRLSSGR